jgi:hypothetical protein
MFGRGSASEVSMREKIARQIKQRGNFNASLADFELAGRYRKPVLDRVWGGVRRVVFKRQSNLQTGSHISDILFGVLYGRFRCVRR